MPQGVENCGEPAPGGVVVKLDHIELDCAEHLGFITVMNEMPNFSLCLSLLI